MKKFYPTPQRIEYTPEGFQNLKQKIEVLKLKRPSVVESLRIAREMGDLSENGAYKAARFEINDIDRELRRLKHLLKYAKVVEKKFNDTVNFGSTVTIDDGFKSYTYKLVGSQESDPSKNQLSIHSPIGKALIGKKQGDSVYVDTPSGVKKYKIIAYK